MRRRWMAAALAGVLLDAAACAANHGSVASLQPERMQVMVRNNNWLDVDVFAVRGASRMRIGFVSGLGTATFAVPNNYAPDGVIRLLIDPVGSTSVYMTDAIVVNPGQRVELNVTSLLTMSSYAVWSR